MLVSGAVQGVGFRWHCRREATARGLAGFVRNLRDGRVEAVFEGDPEAVDSMLAWCADGPPGAGVEGAEAEQQAPLGELAFEIRR